jgi:hypothetical protein
MITDILDSIFEANVVKPLVELGSVDQKLLSGPCDFNEFFFLLGLGKRAHDDYKRLRTCCLFLFTFLVCSLFTGDASSIDSMRTANRLEQTFVRVGYQIRILLGSLLKTSEKASPPLPSVRTYFSVSTKILFRTIPRRTNAGDRRLYSTPPPPPVHSSPQYEVLVRYCTRSVSKRPSRSRGTDDPVLLLIVVTVIQYAVSNHIDNNLNAK